ncbi:phosphatase PAP2 family protein [Patescibacteria group bacterium]|nr:phosphatase PAP2 family protein [Patescibacteria group bacterium]
MNRFKEATFLGLVFALLTFIAWQLPELLRSVDIPLARVLAQFQTLPSIQFFLVVTALAGTLGTVLIGAGAVYFLRNHQRYARSFIYVLLGSAVSANLIKVLIARVRPEPLQWFDPLLTFSFPSGHATAAMALFGSLAFISARLTEGRMRTFLVGLSVLLVFLIGLSRLMLGAHFFSDVVAGYVLGLFWMYLCLPKKN